MLLGHSTDPQVNFFFPGLWFMFAEKSCAAPDTSPPPHWKVLPQTTAGERDTLLTPQLLSHDPAPPWKPNILSSLRMV